jgi:hypothetical protein
MVGMNIFVPPQTQVKPAGLGDYRVSRFFLSVPNWRGFVSASSFSWVGVPFEKSKTRSVPKDKAGVYSFVACSCVAEHPFASYLLYVGKTDRNFRARFLEYFREKDNPKGRTYIVDMLKQWDGWLQFYYAPLPPNEISMAEEALLRALVPPMNEELPADVLEQRKLALR